MTLLEIKKRARFLAVGNETSTAYADAPLLASINSWWETLVGWIEDSSGTWQFADSNNTTLQEATADLPDGTFDIELPTGARILFDVYIKRMSFHLTFIKIFSILIENFKSKRRNSCHRQQD